MNLMQSWACSYKVSFHVTPQKTVAQYIGALACIEEALELCDVEVAWAVQHKYLGLQKRSDGNWVPHVSRILAGCTTIVSELAQLVLRRVVPLGLAFAFEKPFHLVLGAALTQTIMLATQSMKQAGWQSLEHVHASQLL